ncbi:MAG TPA: DNA mismatch repair protein MutS [Gemmatimonadaceae bacterium]|nr:DNA mismatch repair protein MutS [Gemmatimonadaceae bacterium]
MTQTPLMQQYREIKGRHQNAILFFRMGEFYEMFYEDAETASRVLGLTLTARNNGGASDVPLAGVPVKAAGDYVRRLVQQGFRVAICEQVEDPKVAKGVVRREVIETVTPGVAFADDLLDGARNNFICAVAERGASGAASVGIAAADVSTGEVRLILTSAAELDPILARLAPREILVAAGSNVALPASRNEALITEREGWEFDEPLARDDLTGQYGVLSLDGLGIDTNDAAAIAAAGALLRYLRELQPTGLPQLARPIIERPGGVMPLDEMTRRNLELVESLRGGAVEGTLLSVLDRTATPMGARLLRQWILAPLTERAAIDARLDAVAQFATDVVAREAMREALDDVRDVERLAAKAAAGRSTPRELRALGDSLRALPGVAAALGQLARAGRLGEIVTGWDDAAELASEICATLVDRPPLAIGDEPTIALGLDADLDALRELRDGGKDAIARIQADERARTGIASLKVGFNKVFGYYIEVTNANLHLVPPDYQRRQTVTTGERFVTPALKEHEERVLTAAERIETRERELFERLRARAGGEVARLQRIARVIAELDVLSALADVAAREGYVRPTIVEGYELEIVAGRHPVVERMMPRDKFIPNDLTLTRDARMIILTGPNMAGKSTVLRQIGLIALMAQMGSFVPASSARVGVVDRIFTRVGASDNLVRGQSTFMVEMSETSAILHTATANSLVLLDEIGRGTATYDGVSIAWAVSEHLHEHVGCKTVFATHYHELTQLADELVALRNYNVAVREAGDQILFVHRLQPGGADRSYGIEVGRLAGLPDAVIARAREILTILEGEQLARSAEGGAHGPRRDSPGHSAPRAGHSDEQLGFFVANHPLVERLASVDPNALTPIEALTLLASLADEAKRAR